jgi:methylated-DNA-[protein]-cysteine S-methyltransferase
MKQVQWKMDSNIGPLYIVASEVGLQGIFWKPRPVENLSLLNNPIIKKAVKEIEEFLNGKRFEFTVTLDIQGTDFQKRVWRELSAIPYGETRSYKEIAIKLNDKNASRAVGTANGKNPLSLVLPCHRVIASDGTLGGYAGGLDIKVKLLNLEKSILTSKSPK